MVCSFGYFLDGFLRFCAHYGLRIFYFKAVVSFGIHKNNNMFSDLVTDMVFDVSYLGSGFPSI